MIGNAKGVVAVVVSIIFFRNPVNTYSIMGYGITVCGVWLYSQVLLEECGCGGGGWCMLSEWG